MKIAVISTVYKRTPPDGYGGIERVVYYLVEELVRLGHEVVLFATPGSRCSGKTVEVSGYDSSLAPSGIQSSKDIISEEILYRAVRDYAESNRVDVIHDWSFQNLYVKRHPEKRPFIVSTCIPQPPGYSMQNSVACSKAHSEHLGGRPRHVYYGIPLDEWEYNYKKSRRFIHIAKIAWYKGQLDAILASIKTGCELDIIGNVENRLYYWSVVRPLAALAPRVRYISEIKNTNRHLAEAQCLIQTPKWFDAFPLVVLESMASGTPVIAYAQGGVPEQIVDGTNGFLCNGVGELCSAMEKIDSIRPEDCRAYAEERFSSVRMAREYIELYKRVMDGETW